MDSINPDLEKAKALIEECEYEEAEKKLKPLFKNDPSNVEVLDLLGEIYLNIDNLKGAKKMLEKSIDLQPELNPDKYMDYAQVLNEPIKRVRAYKKAIELYINKLSNKENNKNTIEETKESIASAYSSIVSLYMTTDLCDENNAEEICEKSIEEALKYCPESIDALLQLSNLRIIRKRDKEAKNAMYIILDKIKNIEEGNIEESLPERDLLINLSQNFAELKLFKDSCYIINLILAKNDEDLECYYLLAVYQDNYHNYSSSMDTLEKFNNIYMKLQKNTVMEKDDIVNPLIQQYVDSAKLLYNKLSKLQKDNKLIDEHPEDNDENEEIEEERSNDEDVEMK